MSGIKRDKYDKLFSDLIREAANWTCERCGKTFEHHPVGLQASHFYGRRYQGLRYDPRNVFAHCVGCHRRFTENPLAFTNWAGQNTDVSALVWLARVPWKWRPGEKEKMYKHYKEQLKRIKDLRMDGDVSVIPIEPYERTE